MGSCISGMQNPYPFCQGSPIVEHGYHDRGLMDYRPLRVRLADHGK